MATVFPEVLDANHFTEMELFHWAHELPKDWVCYFNYLIDTQECDWIILVPGKGVAVLEIKGWIADRIINIRDQNSIIYKTKHGSEQSFTSPYRQARRYSQTLITKFQEELSTNALVISTVCFPLIETADFRQKNMNVMAEEKIVFLKEDLSDSVRFVSKLNEIFDMQGSVYPGAQPLNQDVFRKVRELFEGTLPEESTPSDGASSPFYSVLAYWDVNEKRSPHDFEVLLQLWKEGKKIIFVTNGDLIPYQEQLHEFVENEGIGHHRDFQLYHPLKNEWKPSIFNFYFYQVELDGYSSFMIYDGEVDLTEEHRSFLEHLHHSSFFNHDQYLVEHAVEHTNLLIKAGAGSGKTYSMITRIQYLIHKHNYSAMDLFEKVYLITFTNEAANNMKIRLQKSLQNYYILTKKYDFFEMIEQVHGLHISTIHSLAKQILQRFSLHLGLGQDLKITSGTYERGQYVEDTLNHFIEEEMGNNVDEIDELRISMYQLKKRVKDLYIKLENQNVDVMNPQLEWGKNQQIDVYDSLLPTVLIESEKKTREYLNENNLVRLKDLIIRTRELLQSARPSIEKYNGKIDYVFVDEFQDTDNEQIDLIKEFQNLIGFSLFIVGDIKQCIYRFRGAEERAFERLLGTTSEDEWGETASFNKNYRTDQSLLNRFESGFQKWAEAELLTYNSKDDQLVSPLHLNNEKEEFFRSVPIPNQHEEEFDSALIQTLIEERSSLRKGEQIAILVRENWQIEHVRNLCLQEGIYVETDKGGDLYTIEPALDLYKLILALKYQNSPEYVANLFTTAYVKDALQKNEIANLNGNAEALNVYFTQKPPMLEWSTYLRDIKLKPVLSVLWNIRSETKPWLRYSAETELEPQDKRKLQNFYKRNLDLIFEELIKFSESEHLTINKIEQFLKLMIVTKQKKESRQVFHNPNDSQIICTTVHKAKGLEYSTVIVPFTGKEMQKEKTFSEVDVIVIDNRKVGYQIKLHDEESVSNHFNKNSYVFNDFYRDEVGTETTQKSMEETRILYVAMTRAIRKFVYFSKPNEGGTTLNWKMLIEMGDTK